MTTPPETGPVALAGEDDHTRSEWEALAAGVLRKAGRLGESDPDSAVWEKLATSTLDGIAITPLGTPEVTAHLATSGRPTRAGDWDIRTLVANPDAGTAAAAVLNDLENGATSVWVRVGEHALSADDLAVVLKDVLLDAAAVVLDAPGDPVAAGTAFAAVLDGRRPAPGTNLGADPVGAAVRQGSVPEAEAVASTLSAVAETAVGLGALALVADGTAVHDLGASEVQELGYALAVGAAYLRGLVAAGHDVATAASLIEFRFAATDEQFSTIAKLRAARRLWARMLELSGVGAADREQRQHAVTSRPMMTKYDPWVNMLRTCVAAFSAGVGGADAVTVLPFDTRLGQPDEFARRIARNTSSLLISEAHVARVADPAGGSHVIEKLTDDLAVAAWTELDRIEGAGGILATLADGSLARRIEEVAARRDAQIARRTRPITGLSEFPNLAETLPEREPSPAPEVVRPYGHAFEALRDDPAAAKVFLATMGTVAAHTARAGFAANLLAAGGIESINEGRHDDVDAVLAHYRGEQVVCLAGNDAAYAEWGAELVSALREAGAQWVVLAGKPVDGVEVDDTCAIGVDALEFLARTRGRLA